MTMLRLRRFGRPLALAIGFFLGCGDAVYAAQAETPVSRFPQKGATPVTMMMDPTLPDHTIYLPRIANGARRMPVVAWANGGCATVGNRYRRFLTDLASQNMLVVAVGRIGDSRYETDPAAEPFQPVGLPKATDTPNSVSSELTKAIDWAIAENRRPGSRLYGRIDPGAIAVMGHSCGGLQALEIASTDPRVKTTVLLNSGVWKEGPGMPDSKATKASLGRLHGSIAYLSGDVADGAHANSEDDFGRIARVPALWAYHRGTPHTGNFWSRPDDDDYARVTAAWLHWQLTGDRTAARMFVGRDCALCMDPDWVVARKNIR